MKRKLVSIFALIYVSFFVLATFYLYYSNDQLKSIISEQNDFIKQVTGKDSVFLDQSNKYQDSLSKYTEEISYRLNGKKITSDQFIEEFSKIDDERIKLSRQLDSLQSMYDYAKRNYGFDIRMTRFKKEGVPYYSMSIVKDTRADSAEITYQFFKDRIKRTKENTWTADITSEKDLDDINKQLQELRVKSDSIIKNKLRQ